MLLVAAYRRTDLTPHQPAPLFGVPKSAADRIIDHLGPALAVQRRMRFRKDTVLVVKQHPVPTVDHSAAAPCLPRPAPPGVADTVRLRCGTPPLRVLLRFDHREQDRRSGTLVRRLKNGHALHVQGHRNGVSLDRADKSCRSSAAFPSGGRAFRGHERETSVTADRKRRHESRPQPRLAPGTRASRSMSTGNGTDTLSRPRWIPVAT